MNLFHQLAKLGRRQISTNCEKSCNNYQKWKTINDCGSIVGIITIGIIAYSPLYVLYKLENKSKDG